MEGSQIRFDDGAAYEDFMGKWSQLAGDIFLQWLSPPTGLRWVDVGCGNGAFTEMLIQRCAPLATLGVDPSEAQLAFARRRLDAASVQFQTGGATALPCASGSFDAAVMALVLFFVTDPAQGVAEMVRVVRPGGSVCAYSWDILGGGFPFAVVQEEMAAMGTAPLWPPSVEASRMEVMQALWANAGLVEIETREIRVERTFADFETFWEIAQSGPRVAPRVATMGADGRSRLRDRVRARLGTGGKVSCSARANAIKGKLPTRQGRP